MMTSPLQQSSRVFQLWAYTVSMGRLLLRSTKTDESPTRMDIVFQNVEAVHLPALLRGLRVSEADPDESRRVIEANGLLPDADRTVFAISGSGFTGYVVAGAFVTSEDEGDFNEPSSAWPAGVPHV